MLAPASSISVVAAPLSTAERAVCDPKILAFLGPSELCNLGGVSAQVAKAAESDAVWKPYVKQAEIPYTLPSFNAALDSQKQNFKYFPVTRLHSAAIDDRGKASFSDAERLRIEKDVVAPAMDSRGQTYRYLSHRDFISELILKRQLSTDSILSDPAFNYVFDRTYLLVCKYTGISEEQALDSRLTSKHASAILWNFTFDEIIHLPAWKVELLYRCPGLKPEQLDVPWLEKFHAKALLSFVVTYEQIAELNEAQVRLMSLFPGTPRELMIEPGFALTHAWILSNSKTPYARIAGLEPIMALQAYRYPSVPREVLLQPWFTGRHGRAYEKKKLTPAQIDGLTEKQLTGVEWFPNTSREISTQWWFTPQHAYAMSANGRSVDEVCGLSEFQVRFLASTTFLSRKDVLQPNLTEEGARRLNMAKLVWTSLFANSVLLAIVGVVVEACAPYLLTMVGLSAPWLPYVALGLISLVAVLILIAAIYKVRLWWILRSVQAAPKDVVPEN